MGDRNRKRRWEEQSTEAVPRGLGWLQIQPGAQLGFPRTDDADGKSSPASSQATSHPMEHLLSRILAGLSVASLVNNQKPGKQNKIYNCIEF